MYVGWIWFDVWSMNAQDTKSQAALEDTSKAVTDILLIVASILSLVAVGFMIMQASSSSGLEKGVEVALGFG